MMRTFIAVDISSSVRQLATEMVHHCRALGLEAKWVEPENMHLTLQFLGNVRENDIHLIFLSLARAVRSFGPFDVICRRLGAFPNIDRPRVIWLGIDQGHDELVELQSRVAESMSEIGFRGESRRFEPHLTLGRLRSAGGPELAQFLQDRPNDEVAAFDVSEVLVFASHFDRKGPRYEVLGRAELRG